MQSDWQLANARRCTCAGSDEYCPCQNDPDYFNRKAKQDRVFGDAVNAVVEELNRQSQDHKEGCPYVDDEFLPEVLIDGRVDLHKIVAAALGIEL